MPNALSRLLHHFHKPVATPVPTNVARYPVAYTRTPSVPAGGPSLQAAAADFKALSGHYDALTGGRRAEVHFVCNGSNARISREFGNSFVVHGRVSSQQFDPYAKDDILRINSSEISGRNGNTGQPLTHDQQQTLLQAAKFSLSRGYVQSAPFAPDVRMNRL